MSAIDELIKIELEVELSPDFVELVKRAAAELAQLHTDLEYIVGQNKIFLDGMNRYRAELDEWHNAAKFVADGCTDEIHCGCVPILKRELDAANKAMDEARVVVGVCKKQIDYACEVGDTDWSVYAGFASARSFINTWLTAHPEGKE